MKIRLSIDVTKIEKAWLFKGKKGTYLDLLVHVREDGPDQFGNDGFVVQQAPKAEYDAGKRGAILGNIKKVGQVGAIPETPRSQSPSFNDNTTPDDDLPF